MRIPPHLPQFSSRINLVTEEEFDRRVDYDRLKKAGLTSESPWESGDRVSLASEAASKGAYICNLGGIQNGRRLTLFHLCPYSSLFDEKGLVGPLDESWDNIEAALDSDIAHLKAENPDMRAFLTGGVAKDVWSVKLGSSLLKLFKKHDIPYSCLWGTRGWEHAHYDTLTDTWTVSHSKLQNESPKNPENIFAKTHIDSGDELYINGEKVETT